MLGESNPVILNKTKSKHSDHANVKILKNALTKKINSKSYETISFSKNEDNKKNVVTVIHSNGLVQSDVNVNIKNKTHLFNTNDTLDRDDKKRETNPTHNNKEHSITRRFSLPSPEKLQDVQIQRSNTSLPASSLESYKNTHSSSSPPSPQNNYPTDKNLTPVSISNKPSKTISSNDTHENTSPNVTDIINNPETTTPDVLDNTLKHHTNPIISKLTRDKPGIKTIKPKLKLKPKSKLSQSVTLPESPISPMSPTPPSDSNVNSSLEPSAPSLDEMYLEEVKGLEKYLLYKDLVQSESESQLKSESESYSESALKSDSESALKSESKLHLDKTNRTTTTISNSSIIPEVSTPSLLSSSSSSSSSSLLPKSSSIPVPQDPFEPPFTTLSTTMTTIATSTASTPSFTSEETLSKLPKPSSLAFYTQMQKIGNYDTVPPKIRGRKLPDGSIEKIVARNDRLSKRRDSLDFYFDKLSQPSRSTYSSIYSPTTSTTSSTSSFINLPSSYYDTSVIDAQESYNSTSHLLKSTTESIRMMSEPQPMNYDIRYTNFNRVLRENIGLRSRLEDKVEETKFQMMIAITQIALINEQLDILNFNHMNANTTGKENSEE